MPDLRRLGGPVLLTAVLLAACADRPDDAAPEPLRLAASDAWCAPVVERVLARYAEGVTARPAPDDPRYGGTVVVAGGGDFDGGLNGLSTSDQTNQETELYAFHVTLVRLGPALTPEPYLAESWTLGPDEVTFRLRPDLTWHDGAPVTARDVAFTVSRAMDPATEFPNSGWFAFYDAEGIEVVDDRTIRFRFRPHAEVMNAWGSLSIMPEHLLGEVPPGELKAHPFGTQCPVGAGPYLFESYAPGDQWVLRANPWFPEELGRPFIDRYVYRMIPASATRVGELLTGGVHVALGIDPADAPAVEASGAADLRVLDQRAFTFVGWNSRLPGLADPRVRRAITMAVDRQALVQALRGGYGVVAETGVPGFHWAHEAGLQGPAHDPAGARRILEEAGWSDRNADGVRENDAGDELRFDLVTNTNPEREGIGRVFRDQLAEVGIAVNVEVMEIGAVVSRVMSPGARDFGGLILGWSHDFNINERDFFHSESAEGHPYGWSGISDPDLDRLLDALPAIQDRAEALPLWREYQERIVDLQPFTYLYFTQRLDAVAADLRGVEMDLRGELLSIPAWHWDPDRR